jgi:hypothetical protein
VRIAISSQSYKPRRLLLPSLAWLLLLLLLLPSLAWLLLLPLLVRLLLLPSLARLLLLPSLARARAGRLAITHDSYKCMIYTL